MKIICCLFCVLKSMKYSTIYKKGSKRGGTKCNEEQKKKITGTAE